MRLVKPLRRVGRRTWNRLRHLDQLISVCTVRQQTRIERQMMLIEMRRIKLEKKVRIGSTTTAKLVNTRHWQTITQTSLRSMIPMVLNLQMLVVRHFMTILPPRRQSNWQVNAI